MFSKINVFFSSSDKTKINCYNQRAHRLKTKTSSKLSKHPDCESLQNFMRTLKEHSLLSWFLLGPCLQHLSSGLSSGHPGWCWVMRNDLFFLLTLPPAPAHSPGTEACSTPLLPWCHFLLNSRNRGSPVVPFSPPQAHKRKPALTRVSLTIDAQLPRKWDNGRVAWADTAPSFFLEEIKNCAQRQIQLF